MTWTCSECRQLLTTVDKKYKYNLCHICYFNPAVAKLYRTGEKSPLPDVTLSPDTPGGDIQEQEVEHVSQCELDDDTCQWTKRWRAVNPPQYGMPANHPIRRLVEARDRGRMAEDHFQRKIIPPLQIDHSIELDRQVDTDIPVRLMDQVSEWDKDPGMVALVRKLARMPLSEQLKLQRPGDGMIEDGRTINLKSLAMETWRNLDAFSVLAVHCKHLVTELLLKDVKTFDTIHESKAWLSLRPGITRFLNCPRCQLSWPAERIVRDQRFEFKWRNFSFHAKCACEYQGEFIVRDSPNWYIFCFQLFRPEEISHQVDVDAKCDSIIWKLPEELRYRIYEGESRTIIHTPMDTIHAAQAGNMRLFVGSVHRTDQILRAVQATQVVADANEAVLVEKGWGCSMSANQMNTAQLNSLLAMHKDPEFQSVNDEDE